MGSSSRISIFKKLKEMLPTNDLFQTLQKQKFCKTESVFGIGLKANFFFNIQLIFTIIQLIFSTIHESHCTFWYYSWVPLYYFSYFFALSAVLLTKSFLFQLNKLFLNRLYYGVYSLAQRIRSRIKFSKTLFGPGDLIQTWKATYHDQQKQLDRCVINVTS